jgi:hypothetical protein
VGSRFIFGVAIPESAGRQPGELRKLILAGLGELTAHDDTNVEYIGKENSSPLPPITGDAKPRPTTLAYSLLRNLQTNSVTLTVTLPDSDMLGIVHTGPGMWHYIIQKAGRRPQMFPEFDTTPARYRDQFGELSRKLDAFLAAAEWEG